MAAKPVLRMGHPILRAIAAPVSHLNTPDLHAQVRDMLDTMRAKNGAGIAAPQIGISLRIVIFGIEKNPRYPNAEPVPLTILVNPQLEPLTPETEEGWEGCLSVPGMRGWVPRFKRLRYTGYTPEGDLIERVCDGFHARVVQHECDHLDGILYPQRVRDLSRFGYIEELEEAGLLPRIKAADS